MSATELWYQPHEGHGVTVRIASVMTYGLAYTVLGDLSRRP